MQCPVDGTALVIAERSGVEIDYCPSCRGVWLDRGELDKIIDRSGAIEARDAPRRSSSDDGRRKKKDGIGSLLGDIFDF